MWRLLNNTWASIGAGIGLVILLLLFVETMTKLPYHVNFTDSLPRGIYRETKEELKRGALVVECLPSNLARLGMERGWLMRGSCPTQTAPILKRIVAMAGDTVELGEQYVAVNGEVLLNTASLRLDSHGREIPRIARGSYRLEAGQLFLLADNKTSWDNRYTGPASMKDIIATAQPVWTEASSGR